MNTSDFISVVARLDNQADSVSLFVREVSAILKERFASYEIILVEDGSTDGTLRLLKELVREIDCVRVIRLSRRFGVDVALTAGLESAIGDYVVTLDPRTDPPALMPELLGRALKSRGVVCGIDSTWRRRPWSRRVGSRGFHWIARRLLQLEIPPHATYYRVMTRQAVNALVRMRDKSRRLRALTPYIGFAAEFFEYEPLPAGDRPGATLFEEVDAAISTIVSSSTRPLRLVTWLALGASLLNVLYIGYIVAIALFKKKVAEGWVTLSTQHTVMFFLIFLILSVVAEYVGQILYEARDRPLYYVQEEFNSSVVMPQDRRNVVNASE